MEFSQEGFSELHLIMVLQLYLQAHVFMKLKRCCFPLRPVYSVQFSNGSLSFSSPLFFLFKNNLSFGTARCLMCTHSAQIGCYSCHCCWRTALIFSLAGQGPYEYLAQSP